MQGKLHFTNCKNGEFTFTGNDLIVYINNQYFNVYDRFLEVGTCYINNNDELINKCNEIHEQYKQLIYENNRL